MLPVMKATFANLKLTRLNLLLAAATCLTGCAVFTKVDSGTPISSATSGSLVHGLAYSPDGQTLASGSSDETIRLWDALTGKEQFILRGHTTFIGAVWSVAFTPDGKTLISASLDAVLMWHGDDNAPQLQNAP